MKEQLHQLLELANVSSVYIVDDAIGDGSVTYEHFIGLIRKVEIASGLEALNSLDEGLDFEDNAPALEEYSAGLWKAAAPYKQLHYVRRLCELTPTGEDEDLATNLDIARVLQQLREDEHLKKPELVSLSPLEWDAQRDEIASKVPAGKRVLVLFDQRLERSGERFAVTRGIDLVKEIVSSAHKLVFLTGILTYTVTEEGQELDERAKLIADKALEASDLFVLTKKRLEELPHFVDGIKKLLLNEPCEQIKVQAISLGESALQSTKAKLLALDTYDFNRTVLQSSSTEGIWAPETLFRIIDIIYKDEIKEQLLQRNLIPELNKLLVQATALSQIPVPVLEAEAYTKRYSLRRQEIYATANLVNGLFKPIENGDIFEVTGGTGKGLYVLLAQPCDLMIRSNGTRSSEVGHLLKIRTTSKPDLEALLTEQLQKASIKKLHDFNFWKTRGVIEYIADDPQTIGLVSLTKAHVVNLDVLDLAMFSSTGEVVLDISATPPAALHIGLAKRFDKLKGLHEKIHRNVGECQVALKAVQGTLPKELIQGLLPKLSLNDKLGATTLTGSLFSFGIRRVKALREPYAKNLLDKYTRHLSRTGDLHDFAD
ncbi:hypothetical protein IC235_15970 [Hymenobacter sp. BT664]|uniref:Uncharacterized protein n=1 Tax=Hymenobacter montanus TaxID=2771359 RepID=A0A927BEI0_9BACT|nr:hypothetical protein [Hymenobacter montanus]MBD2769386.1 hypothetical protein [Hymenobacter montanus]